jgi:tRNA (mo5U34)-methyltransferase
LQREKAAILDIIDLNNRSVIDIGAWNGYFSFEAKRAGAARVIATDSFVWKHPVFRGRETFDLAHECVGLDIEVLEIDPTELPGSLSPADVVLFLGVFYHLFDPIMVLQKLTELARDVLVIETMQDLLDRKEPGMMFYPEADRPKGTTRWWGPNPACVYELLVATGYARILYQDYPTGTRKRGIYHAFRSWGVEAAYLRRPVDNRTLFDLGSKEGRAAVFGRSTPA